MGKGLLSKVMKYELRYIGGAGDFHEMQERIWALQRLSRQILNETIQMAFHWDYVNTENYNKTGNYLDVLSETGYKTLDGYIYDQLKQKSSDFAAANVNATIQKAWSRYKAVKKDVRNGTMSVPSYKRDQPILIYNKNVKLTSGESGPVAALSLFSQKYRSEHDLPAAVVFSFEAHDSTQRAIIDRLLSEEYRVGQCQLVYEKPKWFLLLTYSFSPVKHLLDPDRVLGVDLGSTNAIYASVYQEYGSLRIEGGEVTEFAKKLESRRYSMQKQARYCGEGRIGHGTKTRVANVYAVKDRIANFRDTINHRYSKALIEYAVKQQCGIIQMEDLTGIKEDTGFPKKLAHWTYYDLQMKIEAKAKEHGITVKKIDPKYTSQRCSKCGYIDKGNRTDQSHFCCLKCGFSGNADFNASQNIAIPGIDAIIAKTIGAKAEST